MYSTCVIVNASNSYEDDIMVHQFVFTLSIALLLFTDYAVNLFARTNVPASPGRGARALCDWLNTEA
jgi:hypothetical protein